MLGDIYFVKLISEINTPEQARKFSWSPQDGGKFDVTMTLVILKSSDPIVLAGIPVSNQMDEAQVKKLLETPAWSGDRDGLSPFSGDHLPLAWQSESYGDMKKEFLNKLNFDLKEELSIKAGARTGQDLKDFFISKGYSTSQADDIEIDLRD